MSATMTQHRDRIEKLKSRLQSRKGKPGLEKNCEAIQREIDNLTTIVKMQEASPVASETSKG